MKTQLKLLKTNESFTPLIARLTLGLVMFPHGAQKALGWFGGNGFSGTMNFFTGQMHVPALFAFLAIAAEFAGSIGLITGLFSRVAALGIAVNMVVATLTVHAANGFFMNWFGTQKGEGFEYHILAFGLAFAVIVSGAGKWSLDRLLSGRLEVLGEEKNWIKRQECNDRKEKAEREQDESKGLASSGVFSSAGRKREEGRLGRKI